MNKFVITAEIVMKMIEHGKIISSSDPNNPEKQNEGFVKEVCKAYKAIYETIQGAEKSEFNK
ncbi:Hypothetical protein LUCI_4977 [Lucifera butyrica]|uniref:Uncharacterized protein n=1 Tax=Lucifera butyrica TaxID=1351585 RepID=A0A498REC6_9FIRM|nr:hypothetical protein [Lucifera butyrica]VBB09679.1 Hypothetical protein LUCI_4977 [Lucifera butyrica]